MRIFLLFLYFFLTSVLYAEPTLHLLSEKKLPFSKLSGKWIFINYWASWCDSCLHEIPQLNQFYDKYKNQNVALFAVNYDMLPMEQQQFLNQRLNIHYPALSKDPADELNLGEIRGIPVTFVFNPEGKLLGALYGEQNERSLAKLIRSNNVG